MTQANSPRLNATKGLATIALLKVNFDAGNDHIDMFMPFILDTIKATQSNDFDTTDIAKNLLTRHGLNIPTDTLQTLLNRAARQGKIKKNNYRYYKARNLLDDTDLSSTKITIEREHNAIALQLINFAKSHGFNIASNEEALTLLLGFIDKNYMPILLDSDPSKFLTADRTLSRKDTAIVARFLQSIFKADPQSSEYILRMVEGFVLQNALLLKDISTAARNFTDLEIYFDTRFLLNAIGLNGETAALAARESLDILRASNAKLAVFEETINEMKRVLKIYEHKLGSSEGIKSLYPTDLTRFFLTQKYKPSDIVIAIALLEKNIRSLGLVIRKFPKRVPEYVLNEADLTQRLKRPEESDLEPRIVHDVDCTAAILTIRAGHKTDSLDDAKAVFSTPTGLVVKNTNIWYKENGEHGIPPVIHQIALSNIAWLKKPASATKLKLHELVALCSAALRPSRKVWGSFITQLRALESSGGLSSDEYIAIVASGLTDSCLHEIEEDAEITNETLLDIVDRVKTSYGDSTVLSQTAIAIASSEANKHADSKRQISLNIHQKTDWVANLIAKGIFWIALLIILISTIIGQVHMESAPKWVHIVVMILTVFVTLVGIFNLVFGVHLKSIEERLRLKIAHTLREWLTGNKQLLE
jgi:hypothetical protein